MTDYGREAMSLQKTACRDRTWEGCNKSAETKKVNIATRFVSWMSTPGKTYRDIKAHVTTLETGRKQKFYRDKKLKSNTGRILRHISLCCNIMTNRRQNLLLLRHCMKKLCRDKVMNVATLKDKVSGSDRETKSRRVMLT